MRPTDSSTPPPEGIWVLCRVPREWIFPFRYTLEAYEGLCLASTLPGGHNLVGLQTSTDRRGELIDVLGDLALEMPVEVLEWGAGDLPRESL